MVLFVINNISFMITITMVNSKISGYGRNEEEAHLNAYKNFFEGIVDDENLYSSLIGAISQMKDSLSGGRNSSKVKKPPKGKNDTAYLSSSIQNCSLEKTSYTEKLKSTNNNSDFNKSSKMNDSTLENTLGQYLDQNNATGKTIEEDQSSKKLSGFQTKSFLNKEDTLSSKDGIATTPNNNMKNSKDRINTNLNMSALNQSINQTINNDDVTSKASFSLSQSKNNKNMNMSINQGHNTKNNVSPIKEGTNSTKGGFSQTHNTKSTSEVNNSSYDNAKLRQKYIRDRLSTNPNLPTNSVNKSFNGIDGMSNNYGGRKSSVNKNESVISGSKFIEEEHDCIYK